MSKVVQAGQRLAGKVAIVTGASSGFGLAIASTFAQHGARVLAADLNEPSAKSAGDVKPENLAYLRTDVTSRQDWEKAVEEAKRKWGRLDVVVNNAGWSYKNQPTLDVSESDFEKCFNVNVRSIFHATSVAIPALIAQGSGGVMLNIASIGSLRPRPGLTWYNASKAAVWNATKSLAAEYGKHQIRVNSVLPLLSGTGLFEAFSGVPYTPENVSKFIKDVPMGRLTETSDVANACLYLASDEAKFVTGVSLEVDGGKTI